MTQVNPIAGNEFFRLVDTLAGQVLAEWDEPEPEHMEVEEEEASSAIAKD